MNKKLAKILPKIIGTYFNLQSYILPKRTAKMAIKLFCSPRAGRIRPKDTAFLDTADREDSFNTKYGTIEYYQWNASGSKTILLLHGWESNAARWRNIVKSLVAEGYHIVAIDAPAHGSSSNRQFDMIQYIEAINAAVKKFEPQVLVGHSVGGASIGFYLSEYEYPSFEKLILLGTPTELTQMVNTYALALGLSKRMNDLIDKQFVKEFSMPINSISASRMVGNIEISTLIIHDQDDPVISINDAAEYHALLPNSELFITHKLGHGLQHKSVFQKVISFLKE